VLQNPTLFFDQILESPDGYISRGPAHRMLYKATRGGLSQLPIIVRSITGIAQFFRDASSLHNFRSG